MIRRPPRSTLDRSSAASDVYKRQDRIFIDVDDIVAGLPFDEAIHQAVGQSEVLLVLILSLIHISEPTRPY